MRKIFLFLVSTIGVLALGLFFNIFFDAPPTRAEHNELRATVMHIKEDLNELKAGQREIITILIEED